jgi:hypothetical protein
MLIMTVINFTLLKILVVEEEEKEKVDVRKGKIV